MRTLLKSQMTSQFSTKRVSIKSKDIEGADDADPRMSVINRVTSGLSNRDVIGTVSDFIQHHELKVGVRGSSASQTANVAKRQTTLEPSPYLNQPRSSVLAK